MATSQQLKDGTPHSTRHTRLVSHNKQQQQHAQLTHSSSPLSSPPHLRTFSLSPPAVYSTLESNGSLNAIKARIRADIYAALDTQTQPTHTPPPQPSNTNLLINELLRDYLSYNNLTHTLSTLLVEANQPLQPPFDRQFVMGELGLVEGEVGGGSRGGAGGGRVPLLYGMVAAMRGEVKERREKEREEKSAANGKEEAGGMVRAAGVGPTSATQQQPQRSSTGAGVEERSVRTIEPVHQQHTYPPPHHRSHLSS